MSDEQSGIEHPPPFGEVPAEFIDPEGDGELEDPSLILESSADMRTLWKEWLCARGSGEFADVQFFGKGIGGVPAPAVDAFKALEAALKASGYQPRKSWSNKCRKIAKSDRYSLHSYGIAIDIDATENPQSSGPQFSGKIQKRHVDAALGVLNFSGDRIWVWGGYWNTPDRMHFQLNQGPKTVAVDPSTLRGAVHLALEGVTHLVTAKSLNLRREPTTSGALIAGLPKGAQVAAQSDPVQENDGYQWLRVEAVVGGQLAKGWVAGKYLEAIGVTTAEPAVVDTRVEPATPGATHRVRASSLNLRTEPTTSGSLVTSLPFGLEVVAQPDPPRESDDYRWIKVKATVAGQAEVGWVASNYLDEIT